MVVFLIRFLFIAAGIYFFRKLLGAISYVWAAARGKKTGNGFSGGGSRARRRPEKQARPSGEAGFRFSDTDVVDVTYRNINENAENTENDGDQGTESAGSKLTGAGARGD